MTMEHVSIGTLFVTPFAESIPSPPPRLRKPTESGFFPCRSWCGEVPGRRAKPCVRIGCASFNYSADASSRSPRPTKTVVWGADDHVAPFSIFRPSRVKFQKGFQPARVVGPATPSQTGESWCHQKNCVPLFTARWPRHAVMARRDVTSSKQTGQWRSKGNHHHHSSFSV